MLGLPVAAHDLYLLPSSFDVIVGERLIIVINDGDAFPRSEAAAPLDQLRDADLISPAAVYNITNLHTAENRVVGEAHIKAKGTLILTVRSIPTYVDLPSPAFREYLKREGLTGVLSQHVEGQPARERYSKYAKALIQSESGDEFYSHVVGFMIEIVPEKNPFSLHPGDELPVQVLVRGKPAADLQIEAARAETDPADVKATGRTDASGHAMIPIDGAGKWRLHTVSMHKCSDPTLGQCWESFGASLTFEIK